MKAFLMAAGLGTRLKPLTDSIPKCLLPIREEPLLGLWLDLCRLHGISDVLVNTHAHSRAVTQYLSKNSRGLNIRITEEKDLLGSAGTLFANRDWVKDESEFWILYADVLTNANLSQMLHFHRKSKQVATLGVYEVSNPTQCGIVSFDAAGIVRDFVEKPDRPNGNLAFSGLLMASSAIFKYVPHTVPADIGFHVLPRLIGKMAAFPIADYVLDIGSPQKYASAQQTWPGLHAELGVSKRAK